MADKNTGKQERPRVTISDKSRDTLETIRDTLDKEAEIAMTDGETYAAGIITGLLAQVEQTLTRVDAYTARVRVAAYRKSIKAQRKSKGTASSSGTNKGAPSGAGTTSSSGTNKGAPSGTGTASGTGKSV